VEAQEKRTCLAFICALLLQATVDATDELQPRVPKDSQLREDPKLRVKMYTTEQPTLEEILESLHAVTGLDFKVDKDLQYHRPDVGKVFMRGAPAWVFMQMLAEADLENGHWEKTETGYRLSGKSLAIRLPPKPEGGADYALWLALGVIVLLIAGVQLHRKIKKAPGK